MGFSGVFPKYVDYRYHTYRIQIYFLKVGNNIPVCCAFNPNRTINTKHRNISTVPQTAESKLKRTLPADQTDILTYGSNMVSVGPAYFEL